MTTIKICLLLVVCTAFVMAGDDQTKPTNIGKREVPEVKTRILGLLGLGRKKRQADEPIQTRVLGMLGRKKRQADDQVQTRIIGGLGRKKRQADEEEIRTRVLGALGRKKRDLTLDQLVQVADILNR